MIKINEISKSYFGHIALDKINLVIPERSIFGLLGPNGSGKSTLLKIMAKLILPDKGLIMINEKNLSKHNTFQLGYMPEERGLYTHMRVGEHIIYFALIKGIDRKTAIQYTHSLLEEFELQNYFNKKIGALSKGTQQKIQFIIAIISKPQILILDEPFSGLDPINKELFSNIIKRINNQGTTIIFSSHDMNSVEKYCDSVALINNGNLILNGKMHEIVECNNNIYEILIGNIEKYYDAVKSYKYELSKKENGICVKIQFNNEIEAQQFLQNNATKLSVKSFNPLHISLSDMFLKTINRNN